METAGDLTKHIIQSIAPEDSHGTDGIGEVFLDELGKLMQRSNRASRKELLHLARLLYNNAANLSYEIDSNGERQLISRACSAGDVVFDVGANKGDWTKTVLETSPDAEIHCFELIPHTAKLLKENLKGTPATINPCGLSDKEDTIIANYCKDHSELSGIYDVHSNFSMEKLRCKVTTGNKYCNHFDIKKVRLLKVDCEGAELAVLQGFKSLLRQNAIDIIQFEYGKANIKARSLLLDFYSYLEPFGYVVGKLYPDGVDFKPYELEDEDYTGPNYVACTGRDADLLSRLRDF